MAEKPFMGPSYDKLIDDDAQFIRPPMESMQIASRKSVMGKTMDNGPMVNTLKHVD